MDKILAILNRVVTFQGFYLSDDPSQEHRRGKFIFHDETILWEIFCADIGNGAESRDALDSNVTIRILMVKLSSCA